MMQSSINQLLGLCLLLGCTVANAGLSPFYNFREEGKTKLDEQSRRVLGDYGRVGKHKGHTDYTVSRYGQKLYEEVDCESFYGKSHKKSKKSKKSKKYKGDKKCKNYKVKPDPNNPDGRLDDQGPSGPEFLYTDLIRFVMVREEAGTPTPDNFGVGDSLALNGQVYYWEDYEDNLIAENPVGNFVTLCTGISQGDDLMCTYEIALGIMTNKNRNGNPVRGTADSVEGMGAFVANGPNYMGENTMIVTGTEFEFASFKSGTLVTQEDLVNPYLYADLYLL